MCLNKIAAAEKFSSNKNKISILVASHNQVHLFVHLAACLLIHSFSGLSSQTTIELATNKMMELQIGRASGSVYFGQLLGMSDYLTYPLAFHGFKVTDWHFRL